MQIGNGNAAITDMPLYEKLETFNWISITRRADSPNQAVLTYAGKDLYGRLMKNKLR